MNGELTAASRSDATAAWQRLTGKLERREGEESLRRCRDQPEEKPGLAIEVEARHVEPGDGSTAHLVADDHFEQDEQEAQAGEAEHDEVPSHLHRRQLDVRENP